MSKNRAQEDSWGLHKTAQRNYCGEKEKEEDKSSIYKIPRRRADSKDVGVTVQFHLKTSVMGISRPPSTRVKLARPQDISACPVPVHPYRPRKGVVLSF